MNLSSSASSKTIAVVNRNEPLLRTLHESAIPGHAVQVFKSSSELYEIWKREHFDISVVISCGEMTGADGIVLFETLRERNFPDVPFIICASGATENFKKLALKAGVADVFAVIPSPFEMQVRLSFLIENWQQLQIKAEAGTFIKYRTSPAKRLFDIVLATLALLILSPFFLLIAILLRLESKGPVFYYSLRVGTGYKLFKFYKFRSMYVNADQKLKDLKHLNQYNADRQADTAVVNEGIALCEQCSSKGQCQNVIYADKIQWCERDYFTYQKSNNGSAFIKIKDDPRITRVGNFIRNFSIDELPQLWNVLIGDMSIVGNRPLPLYEAEKLTTDTHVLRFLAPAGMTGLWQVEKRGKGEMSEEERLMLDNVYAQNHSFIKDIRLILRTIPAVFQKENV